MPIATFTAMLMMVVFPVASGNSTYPVNASTTGATPNTIVLKATPLAAESLSGGYGIPLTEAQKDVEQQVKAYYKDTPILAEIAFCESSFRQVDTNGNLVRGKVDNADVGVMQVNERYHGKRAAEMGYDLHTLEGNMAYAKWLYSQLGTKPWNSSSDCWSKYQ